jgi:hypothetical protein
VDRTKQKEQFVRFNCLVFKLFGFQTISAN